MHIIVLGGGISGLATAWFLKRQGCQVTVLEASSRAGGYVHTDTSQGFLFELGPRSCRGNAIETLSLVKELGLQHRVITGAKQANKRFLYLNQRLRPLPSNLFSFVGSSLTRPLLWPLLREWSIPRSKVEDESVHDFIKRRFNDYAADTFMNPLVSGIYAGDPRKLSLKSCFPSLHQWEQEKGSIIRGLLFHKKASDSRRGIFSLKGGMQELTDILADRLGTSVCLNSKVVALTNHSATTSDGKIYHADHVVSTLPASALAPLVPNPSVFADSQYSSVAVVGMGFHQPQLKERGFGYLVPASQGERVLGMVWDSCVFPEQNHARQETRITCMIGGSMCLISRPTRRKILWRLRRKPLIDTYISR